MKAIMALIWRIEENLRRLRGAGLRPMLLALICCAGAQLQAQPVITGVLDYVSPNSGTLRVRSEHGAYRPVMFYRMNSASIMTETGSLVTVADLAPGMEVTIYFSRYGQRWAVSKVLIRDPAPSNPGESWPVESEYRITAADLDGDPTTRGPDSAAFDNDPTTVPARRSNGYFRRW